MNFLVTGGGGFLGLEIVKELLARGHLVTSLARNEYTALKSLEVPQVKCDLSDFNQVEKINFSEFNGVFHVAAKAGVWGKKDEYMRINFLGTKNLMTAAKKAKLKYMVYTSTPSVVFEKDSILGGDESLPYAQKYYTHYAYSKKCAEDFFINTLTDDFQGLSLRPHLIWGEDDPHIVPRLLERAQAGQLKIIGDGKNLVDIIYVKNAAIAHVDAMLALMKNKKLNKQCYFVGQEKPVYLWDFINSILELNNLSPVQNKVSYKAAFFIGFILEKIYQIFGLSGEPKMTRFTAMQLAKSHYFSHEKAKRDFNYQIHYTTEQALLKTFTN